MKHNNVKELAVMTSKLYRTIFRFKELPKLLQFYPLLKDSYCDPNLIAITCRETEARVNNFSSTATNYSTSPRDERSSTSDYSSDGSSTGTECSNTINNGEIIIIARDYADIEP